MVVPNFIGAGAGLWMLTFTAGQVYLPLGSSGHVDLKVDGQIVAKSRVDRNGQANEGVSALSLNTIQPLYGQTVTIEWSGYNGAYILGDGSKGTHWTGVYLGSGTRPLPDCEFPGQTLEYPGSCRFYYICMSDGLVGVRSCCPALYSPTDNVCISEDEVDVENICPSEDVCTSTSSVPPDYKSSYP